ncbi:MAG: hypothetical protein J6X16_06040 [Bacteroidales bacterium]|nr:hypothetical protein [Bacteroidales bacterium]
MLTVDVSVLKVRYILRLPQCDSPTATCFCYVVCLRHTSPQITLATPHRTPFGRLVRGY